MRTIALAFLFTFGLSAFAHEHESHGTGPCKELRTQCEKAGFTVGGHKEGKGLIMDCMGKVGKGEAVAGVAFNGTDPGNKACMDHLAEKKEHIKERRKEKREAKKAAKGSAS